MIYAKKLVISLSVLFFLFYFTGNMAAQVQQPSGEIQAITRADIAPKPHTSSYFNELWSYHFILEEDIQLNIVFSTASFGRFMSPVGGARLSLVGFDDKIYQVAREYPKERLAFVESETYLRMRPDHEVWFRGNLDNQHEVRFVTSKDGVDYDVHLIMENIVDGFRWGDGLFRFGNEKIGIQVPIPKADVHGFISINGNKREVSGTAYMDQTWQSNITPRLIGEGFRFFVHSQDSWEAAYFLIKSDAKKDAVPVGFSVYSDGDSISLLRPRSLRIINENRFRGSKLAEQIRVDFIGNSHRSIVRTRDRERYALLNELSGWQYRIARSFLGGEVVEFRGEALINNERIAYYNFFRVE